MRETPCTSIVRTPLQGRPSTPKRASYPCLGSSSLGVPSCHSWGRRLISTSPLRGGLKWSEPYPRPPLSPRRTGDDVSTVSIQGHRSPRRRIPSTNYHEPSSSRPTMIQCRLITNDPSTVQWFWELSPWVILMADGNREDGLAIIGDLGLLLFFHILWIDFFFFFFCNFCYSSCSFSFEIFWIVVICRWK